MSGTVQGDLVIQNDLNNDIFFGTNGDNVRMLIQNDGNVGIGTTGPGSNLEIEGTTGVTIADSSNPTTHWTRLYHDSAGNAPFKIAMNSGASEVDVMTFEQGNVGIGTTAPTQALEVNGLVRVGRYTTAALPTCDADALGSFAFDTTEDRPYICTAASGGTWKPLDSDYDKDGITDTIDTDDNNDSDATAAAADVVSGKTFYAGGEARTGTQPLHSLTSVSPVQGSAEGGYTITLSGSGFSATSTVTIGGVSATNVTVVSANSVTATVPASGSIGAKDVVITHPDESTSTLTDGFTYLAYATGGTHITYDGDYKIHHFLSDGTFTVVGGSLSVDYLVVGGGGSGAFYNGGGGGAGGLKTGTLSATTGAKTITIGAGGQGDSEGSGASGEASLFDDGGAQEISAAGGGAGGAGAYCHDGSAGGSGGGGGEHHATGCSGGAGTGGQGYAGGVGGVYKNGGGGGGASAVGASGEVSGNGGIGVQSSITGTAIYYAGGGGGAGYGAYPGASGGAGGGGDGSVGAYVPGSSGTANTGGGGGGAGTNIGNGGNGGSGVVILRYQYQ